MGHTPFLNGWSLENRASVLLMGDIANMKMFEI